MVSRRGRGGLVYSELNKIFLFKAAKWLNLLIQSTVSGPRQNYHLNLQLTSPLLNFTISFSSSFNCFSSISSLSQCRFVLIQAAKRLRKPTVQYLSSTQQQADEHAVEAFICITCELNVASVTAGFVNYQMFWESYSDTASYKFLHSCRSLTSF